MPIGSLSVFSEVIRIVILNAPKKVLDVGVGYGINGAAIRNWMLDAVAKEIKIDGLEPFKKYNNPLWKCYDKVINEPLETVEIKEKYNVIVCTDVCEHWKPEDITGNLEKLKSLLTPSGVLLLSTPAIWIEQGAVNGNDYEIHKSRWDVNMLIDYGFHIVRDGNFIDSHRHIMIIAEYINK